MKNIVELLHWETEVNLPFYRRQERQIQENKLKAIDYITKNISIDMNILRKILYQNISEDTVILEPVFPDSTYYMYSYNRTIEQQKRVKTLLESIRELLDYISIKGKIDIQDFKDYFDWKKIDIKKRHKERKKIELEIKQEEEYTQEYPKIIEKLEKGESINLSDIANNNLIRDKLFNCHLDVVIRGNRLKVRDEKMKYEEVEDLLRLLRTVQSQPSMKKIDKYSLIEDLICLLEDYEIKLMDDKEKSNMLKTDIQELKAINKQVEEFGW